MDRVLPSPRWTFSRFFLLLLMLLGGPCLTGSAAWASPGWKSGGMEAVSPEEAYRILDSRGQGERAAPLAFSATPAAAQAVAAEITELARALRHDPDLIFRFVHDEIEFEPLYGARKGALGTLLDRRGGAFDQAALLVELLRAAGHTADYVRGTLHVPFEQLGPWLGLEPSQIPAAHRILINGGIPVPQTRQENLGYLPVGHAWVQVQADGQTYSLDPSFKVHEPIAPVLDAEDLARQMGYERQNFLAKVGGTLSRVDQDGDSFEKLTELKRDQLRALLSGYATRLADYLRSHHPDKDLASLIGGHRIRPWVGQVPRNRYHPLHKPGESAGVTSSVPSAYRSTVRPAANA